jgi:integrase
MGSRRKQCFSYSAGEKGRNRVRAFKEAKTGALYLEWYEERPSGSPTRRRAALGHRDIQRAKLQADEAAARLAKGAKEQEADLTLGTLFDIYGAEVTPTKGEHSQKHDQRAMDMFLRFFGADRVVSTLSFRDWSRFIQDRTAGRIAPAASSTAGVGQRMVEQDLRFMLAVFNWATMSRGNDGQVLLDKNPFKGFAVPREKNPNRVPVTEQEYQALWAVAQTVNWRFYVALVLAHETGHRIGAVRSLLWSDVDLEAGRVRWREETEKTGYEHYTPLTTEALEALKFAREQNPGIGDAPVLPSPKDASQPMSRNFARDLWEKGQKAAKLPPKKGRGWHSLSRKFGIDFMHLPLKVLTQLGGWKDPQTILKCYQHADQDALREALKERRVG